MGIKAEMIGKTFGRLTVEAELPPHVSKSGRRFLRYLCSCSCGKRKEFFGEHLRSGATVSCGCFKIETTTNKFTKHGHALEGQKSLEYTARLAMIARCENPKNNSFLDYGGRGITVCQEWRKSFKAFLNDMGQKPSPDHSIDRIDVNGNYEPGNCRWATQSEQQLNKRPRKKKSK
jgi:hypothetical protein